MTLPQGAHLDKDGYVIVWHEGKYVAEHRVVAAAALGKPLPRRAQVHHVEHDDRTNNAGSNLVLCEDNSYHRLLHLRRDALDACGNADWRKCVHCSRYDDVKNMVVHSGGSRPTGYAHSLCRRTANRLTEARRPHRVRRVI